MSRLLLPLAVLAGFLPITVSHGMDPAALSGGSTTVFSAGQNAYALPLANLSREKRRAHVVGNSFFNKNWVISPASTTARDGLGPLFHARSCSGCHVRDGRGRPPELGETPTHLLFRLSIPGKGPHGEPIPDPSLGGQVGVFGIPHMEPEAEIDISFQTIQGTFADGSSYELLKPIYSLSPNLAHPPPASDATLGPRIANPVFGLGLLEAVPESTILALADPDDHDGDGISGRPNWVWHPVSERKVLGRFGWKANQPDLLSQTSGAFVGDIGITTPIHSQEELTPAQRSLAPPDSSGGSPEITYPLLNRVVTYLQTLAPPARRDVHEEEVILGERLFHQAQCATCHVPKLTTGSFPDLPEVAHQIIQPYTDLLLHDMGNELADGRDDFEATGSEWRTPPLWGIGLTETVNGHTRFLHDGRARNLEEAILWHGGEASTSAQHYREYSLSERKALLRFLDSL